MFPLLSLPASLKLSRLVFAFAHLSDTRFLPLRHCPGLHSLQPTPGRVMTDATMRRPHQSSSTNDRIPLINGDAISPSKRRFQKRFRRPSGGMMRLVALPLVVCFPLIILWFTGGNVGDEATGGDGDLPVESYAAGRTARSSAWPRAVFIQPSFEEAQPEGGSQRVMDEEWVLETSRERKRLADSERWNKYSRDPLHEGDCAPMRPWQEYMFPSCNNVHELGMTTVHMAEVLDRKGKREQRFRKINRGGYNDVFDLHRDPPNEEHIVMKTLEFGTKYTDRNFDRVRRDVVIQERGSKSLYMVDLYGHCGFTQLSPLGVNGTLDAYIYAKNPPEVKLVQAREAAFGLAAAHDLDGDGISSITQGDLKADQYLLVDGHYKLGDFNRGRFLRNNTVTGETCTYTIGHNDAKYRSPEEYRYDGENAKIDVWALGSIFFSIVTGKTVWHGVEEDVAQALIAKNETPPLDEKWATSEDPAVALLVKVMYEMCFVPNIKARASAPEVARYLEVESDKILAQITSRAGSKEENEEFPEKRK